MKAVLENRPYQYNRWMIIVQQWEPVISPTFPSQIPFWINLKGIPLHFWDDKILRDIGQELGHLENYILTKTTARVRVMMDGLKPLPQDTILEFSAGKECIITLEYEKLENFCTYCLQLSHLSHDCPTKLAESAKDARKKDTSYNTVKGAPRTHLAHSQYHHKQYRDERRTNMPRLPIDEAFQQRIDRHGKPFGERAATYQSRALPLRNKITPTIYHEVQRHERSPPCRDELTTTSPPYSTRRTEPTRGHLNRNTRSPADQQWRVKAPNVVRSGSKELSADKSRPPLEINLDKEDFPQPQPAPLPPPRSTEEVMEELREVTYQYTNVADPVDSAARRQRVLDGEVHCLMEQTAAGIIAREQEAQQAFLTATKETADWEGRQKLNKALLFLWNYPNQHNITKGGEGCRSQNKEKFA